MTEEELNQIQKSDIINYVTKSKSNEAFSKEVIVILTNKSFLYGLISLNNNILVLQSSDSCHKMELLIPFQKIAGLIPFRTPAIILKETGKIATFKDVRCSSKTTIALQSYQLAKKLNFKADFQHMFYDSQLPPKSTVKRFSREDIIYFNLDYYLLHNKGIKGLGIGLLLGSLSIGWDKSLWSKITNSLKKKENSINKLCEEEDVLFTGYIFFPESKPKEMDGSNWIETIITSQKIENIHDIKGIKWFLCYFKENAFSVPKSFLVDMENRIKIYGIIAHFESNTKYGKIECFIKAEAAIPIIT